MKRKEEITKKIEQLENDLRTADMNYEYYANQAGLYSAKKIEINEQINDLKEELQKVESKNLISSLNSAIIVLKNYCESRHECENCLLGYICKKEPCWWAEI